MYFYGAYFTWLTNSVYCFIDKHSSHSAHFFYPCSIQIVVLCDYVTRVTQGVVSGWHKEWYWRDTRSSIRMTQGVVSAWHKEWYQGDTRSGIGVTQGVVSGWHKEWYQDDTRSGIGVTQGVVSGWQKEWYWRDTRSGIWIAVALKALHCLNREGRIGPAASQHDDVISTAD
jgi:hypothetical protein